MYRKVTITVILDVEDESHCNKVLRAMLKPLDSDTPMRLLRDYSTEEEYENFKT